MSEARRVLIEEGYDALVLRQIASTLGMQLGNLQYYFPNRESLLLEILLAEARADLETLRELLEGDGDPQRRLREIVSVFVRRWRGPSGVVHTAMSFLSKHNAVLRKAYREYYAAFYADLERALEAADPGHAPRIYVSRARLLNALMDGAAMQRRVGPLKPYLESVHAAARAILTPPGRR